MATKAIALSADYGYINQITTMIKSILYHNQDIHIYVINTDIPAEWFQVINAKLEASSSFVHDRKITSATIDSEHVGLPHISKIAFGKILIPDLFPNTDRILYLDSDMIVNGDLTPLFNLDLGDNSIAVAEDIDQNNGEFNTGVILYDLRSLHKIPNLVADELRIGQNPKFRNADQDVMNHYFKDHFYHLPLQYNYQIGMDEISFYANHPYYYEKMAAVKHPVIIHYLTYDKPWLTLSSGRLRDLWWKYYGLDFSDVLLHEPLMNLSHNFSHRFFTFTNTQYIEKLKPLIQHFPNCEFNIGAWSHFGDQLIQLLQYPNVKLYQSIIGLNIDQLVDECDAYLDINYENKERQIIDRFEKLNKPIFSYDDIAENPHQYPQYFIAPKNDVQQMARLIQKNLS